MRHFGSFLAALFVLINTVGCNEPQKSKEVNSSVDLESVFQQNTGAELTYTLPSPSIDGKVSVEKTLANRRSHRNFVDREISMEQLSQILWAAYGVTEPMPDYLSLRGGLRTAPSAGGLYPFEIYVVVGKVKNIEAGVYRYISKEHMLVRSIDHDIRRELCIAALGQKMIEEAPVVIVYTAIFSRMTDKYGDRGRERYVCMDLGHSAQNIYLQVEALNLGTCAVGAFNDSKISEVLQLPTDEEPLYIMPIGQYLRQREF